jgi:hypothetical protein
MNKAKLKFIVVLLLFFAAQNHLIWAFDNTPPVTTHSLNGTIGSNGWYTTSVELGLSASDSDGGVASTEYWVDSNQHNTVNYLPNSPTQTEFNVSSDGTHVVNYFSTNLDGVAEATQTTPSFKIDTSSPSNWRNFTATEVGNDHTFRLSITVDDPTSGLDPSSAYYNYSVDGVTFGYYSTTTSCGSPFVTQNPSLDPPQAGSGWKAVPTLTPNTSGANTITFTSDAIDFCNSSWNLSEAVQFYIKDLAGNESYKLQLLFGPWIDIEGGSLHSQGQISFAGPGTTDYLVSSGVNPIINMASSRNWQLTPYSMPLNNMSYSYWYSKLGSPTLSLPGGDLPTVKGVYRVNGDFTIDNGTIPSNLSTAQNFGAIIFVNGSLNINNDFSLHPSSDLVFIVRDTLRSSRTVDLIHGFFIVDDDVDLSYNGNNGDQLVLIGGIVGSGNWRFGKNIGGSDNVGTPAEKFVAKPAILANKDIVEYLSNAPNYQWTEVAP